MGTLFMKVWRRIAASRLIVCWYTYSGLHLYRVHGISMETANLYSGPRQITLHTKWSFCDHMKGILYHQCSYKVQRISDRELQSSYSSSKPAGVHAVIPSKFILNFVVHWNILRQSKARYSRAWQQATWERMTPTIKCRAGCQHDLVILKRGPGVDSQ